MTDALFTQVKRKLNITWEDEDTNARIKEIIASAIPSLKHKLGITETDFDFSISGAENTLFLAYCLYDWEHVVNEFDTNYSQLIAEVRARREVEYYLNSGEAGNDSEIQ